MSLSDNTISGIYIITNLITKKVYIGSSINCKSRLKRHLRELTHNKHSNSYLQNAWNKYGEANFTFELLELVIPKKKDLLVKEQYWMDKLQSYKRKYGYNINPKADSPLGSKRDGSYLLGNTYAKGHIPWNKGKKLPVWVKEKFSSAKLKNPVKHWKGKKRSKATKTQISKKLSGRKLSKEHIKNIRLGYTGNQYHKILG